MIMFDSRVIDNGCTAQRSERVIDNGCTAQRSEPLSAGGRAGFESTAYHAKTYAKSTQITLTAQPLTTS